MQPQFEINQKCENPAELDDVRIRYVMHLLALKAAESVLTSEEERKMLDRADALLVLAIQAESRLLKYYPEYSSLLPSYYLRWREEISEKEMPIVAGF